MLSAESLGKILGLRRPYRPVEQISDQFGRTPTEKQASGIIVMGEQFAKLVVRN
jgi:hypothetical protein